MEKPDPEVIEASVLVCERLGIPPWTPRWLQIVRPDLYEICFNIGVAIGRKQAQEQAQRQEEKIVLTEQLGPKWVEARASPGGPTGPFFLA